MNDSSGNQTRNCQTSLPVNVKTWFMVSNFVNLIALVYSIYSWYSKKDFTFVSWVVIGWSLLSSIVNIFVNHRVGFMYKDHTQRNASILFTLIWILIAILKLSVEGFSI
mgnify:FL=1